MAVRLFVFRMVIINEIFFNTCCSNSCITFFFFSFFWGENFGIRALFLLTQLSGGQILKILNLKGYLEERMVKDNGCSDGRKGGRKKPASLYYRRKKKSGKWVQCVCLSHCRSMCTLLVAVCLGVYVCLSLPCSPCFDSNPHPLCCNWAKKSSWEAAPAHHILFNGCHVCLSLACSTAGSIPLAVAGFSSTAAVERHTREHALPPRTHTYPRVV